MTKENLRGRQELIIHGHRHHWTQDTEQRQTIPKKQHRKLNTWPKWTHQKME
jgi:calcineurin-like phosphoesterase family protein